MERCQTCRQNSESKCYTCEPFTCKCTKCHYYPDGVPGVCNPARPCPECKGLLAVHAWDGSRGDMNNFEWMWCGKTDCEHVPCALIFNGMCKTLHEAVVMSKRI